MSGLLSIRPLLGKEMIAHTHTHTQKTHNMTFVCLLDTERLWRNERVSSLSVQEQKREIILVCLYRLRCVLLVRGGKQNGMTKEKESLRESVSALSEICLSKKGQNYLL